MKIQIKPVYYSEFFPNRKKQPIYPITRDYSVQPTRYSGKYCVSMKTRKQLAESVSKKLSLPLQEVMETYKDKIETAYWKNIHEYIKAEVTDWGIFGYKNLRDTERDSNKKQNDFNGFSSVDMMIPNIQGWNPNVCELYQKDNGQWTYLVLDETEESLLYRFKQDATDDFIEWHKDVHKTFIDIESIDVEFYNLDGDIVKKETIVIELQPLSDRYLHYMQDN